ncbi:MAG: hypothetical protein HRT80_08150 [Henriciella sp.]|nr:hypothetical protein [Henriciella sp.]
MSGANSANSANSMSKISGVGDSIGSSFWLSKIAASTACTAVTAIAIEMLRISAEGRHQAMRFA